MDKTLNTQKHSRPALIAAALGLIVALTAGTFATVSADAALDDGSFCIVASSDEGKFTGDKGPAGCGEAAPEQPQPEVAPFIMHRLTVSFASGSPYIYRDISFRVYDAENGDFLAESVGNPNLLIDTPTAGGPRPLRLEISYGGHEVDRTLVPAEGWYHNVLSGEVIKPMMEYSVLFVTSSGTAHWDPRSGSPAPKW